MLARDFVYTKRGKPLEDRLAELHISGCLLFVLLFRSIRTAVLSPVDTRAMFLDCDESGTFWSRILFAVYTQNMNPQSKLSGFVMSPKTFEFGI